MRESSHLYDYPKYYDLAFSFRDTSREVEVFQQCIKQYSTISVNSVLELAAGTAPHLAEWARRGIEYVGIDTNENMLSYVKSKALKLGIAATILRADLRNFSIGRTVDFAYTMLGSLHVSSTEEIDSHFSSVAEALRPGGLYFLDWCVNFQWAEASSSSQTWSIDKSPVQINVNFKTEVLNPANQTVRNTLTANIDDDGKHLTLEETDVIRTIFPQEFLLLVQKSAKFEFVGWWNNWKLEEPIGKATRIRRPIVLLRRRN